MRVVVIGSGIVGAAAAYRLSGRDASVTVVNGGYQGEATQAGAGIVCPWVDHPEDDDWYRLTREGARRYPGLVESLGEDIGYAKVGALLVAEDPAELEPVRTLLARRRPDAPEMGDVSDVMTPSELFPPLSDDLSALLVPGAARVDGRSVRDALLRAAMARGARVLTGAATLTEDGQVLLHPLGDEAPTAPAPPAPPAAAAHSAQDGAGGSGAVSGETTSWRQAAPAGHAGPAAPGEPPVTRAIRNAPAATGGTPLEADMVIVAAGAWTGEVCRPLGVELPVFPRRGQILHVTMEGVDTAWWPIVLPGSGPYLLGFPDSRVVIGATVEDVGFAARVTMGGLDEVIESGLRLAPGLFGATVAETRVGLRPVNAPGPALIGRLTDRVVVATGLSAYGLTAGPLTGEIAAALALGEEPPLDISPYAPPAP
ncbi:FAD-binding oxidoreductase [Nonomuraea sp. NN258]|uniref:NAD(P)/FAD-dependent oxidoreductase n=1 Tax=Nonomuraea antri TaxID=2730852 RepID=UPI001568A162|nr:FAD-dependent oxidoreductase [Nonomuraea antri]NRQ39423.1 FAD-binding oxidoreductase [Nonomuraea antri]